MAKKTSSTSIDRCEASTAQWLGKLSNRDVPTIERMERTIATAKSSFRSPTAYTPASNTATPTTFRITTPCRIGTTNELRMNNSKIDNSKSRWRGYFRFAIRRRLCGGIETVEVFDSRPGIENDNTLAIVDLSGGPQLLERRETSCGFRCH